MADHKPRDGITASGGTSAGAGGGAEQILVVDDDANLRDLVVRALSDLGYETAQAVDGAEALEKLQLRPTPQLMLADVVLPGDLRGSELAHQARLLIPGIKVLFTSGYPERIVHKYDQALAGADFISKPYRSGDLAQKVREVLNKPVS